MPGIVGLFTEMPRDRAERQLMRMLDSMRHDSTYRTGTWINEGAGVYIGWTARRGSFAECMPLCAKEGDRVLIFSGEDFPDPAEAARFKHRQPCGYLVEFAKDTASFPRQLNGRFHGLSVDLRTGQTLLFNDRYGMHRIYYHQRPEAFYFAAEAKAILANCADTRGIDPTGLGEFISCGCTLGERSLFRDISLLPPGAAWQFREGVLARKGSFFDPAEWEQAHPLDDEEFYRELRAVFSRNLPRYFKGPEPAAVSLTGGFDTRIIMAWHKPEPGSLPCYSFGGMFRECQDVKMARQIAHACGQPHRVIGVGDDFLSQFPHYAERTVYLTDGCVEVKRSPDLYINERAAQIAPVRMTGNFGGEVLRGVRAFKPVDLEPGPFHPDFEMHIQGAVRTYQDAVCAHPVTFSAFRQAPWHNYGIVALEESQLALRAPYLDNDLIRTLYRAPLSALNRDAVSLRLIADGNAEMARIRTDRGLGGTRHGLDVAMRRAWLEFTFKAEYAYDYGMPQWMARIDHMFAPLRLERLYLGRHKFYHFRVWYRDALAGYVREMLLDSKTLSRPYLQREKVEYLVKAHIKGNRNYTSAIHKILTLEHIHRLFLDS